MSKRQQQQHISFISRWDGEDDLEEVQELAKNIGRISSIRSESLRPSDVKGALIISGSGENNNESVMSSASTATSATHSGSGKRLAIVIERSSKTSPDLYSFTYSISDTTVEYLRDQLAEAVERQDELEEEIKVEKKAIGQVQGSTAKKQGSKKHQQQQQNQDTSTLSKEIQEKENALVGFREEASILAEDLQILTLANTLGSAIFAAGALSNMSASSFPRKTTDHVGGSTPTTTVEGTAATSTDPQNATQESLGGVHPDVSDADFELMNSAGDSSGVRGIVHRKLRPLQVENTIMRSAMGIKPEEKVTAILAAQKMKAVTGSSAGGIDRSQSPDAHPHHQSATFVQDKHQRLSQKPKPSQTASVGATGHLDDGSQGGHHHRNSSAEGHQQQQNSNNSNRLQYDLNADTTHSPLAWDMETEAAINSRTKYDPYKKRRAADGRQLDSVTQQQLVARLHDKSVDLRDKRKKDNEERIQRELGRLEKRTLSSDEQSELGIRLHDKWRAHTNEMKEKLRENYLRPLSPEKKLDQEAQKTMAVRLHDECREKTKVDMEKLQKMYITDKDQPKVKLNKAQQEDMANRLSVYHVRDYNNS